MNVKSNDVLYVRYYIDTDSKEVGRLNPGTIVECLYCKNGWMSINGFKGDKGLGYVNTYFLELV